MKTILVTGSSGYVGTLLCEQLLQRDDVSLVIGLDKNEAPEALLPHEKFHFIHKNTAEDWEEKVSRLKPDTVIHTAWQIRELYGKKNLQELWNINGSHQVFDYVFHEGNVDCFVHFSTVASYGAYRTNTREQIFTEKDGFRITNYSYAEEKRIAEKMLYDLYDKYTNKQTHLPEVFIIRPASITGQRGRARTGFSLQSILQGKAKDSLFAQGISKVLSFTPISKLWTRQFVHENDVVDSVIHLVFNTERVGVIEALNLCPPGEYITGEEMASILSKKPVTLPPLFYKWAFLFAWHISRGRVPTPKGSYKTYCYPIVVDGSKITKRFGYQYKKNIKEAITS